MKVHFNWREISERGQSEKYVCLSANSLASYSCT